jgi:hypothetical protein
MLRFYLRFLWNVWKLVTESTSRVNRIVAGVTAILATVGPLIAPWVAPWLAGHGKPDLAAWLAWVPSWWSVVPITLLVLYGLLKANYELHAKTEAERDALATTLAAKEASGPKLGVVFDPKCESCFSQRTGVVCVGVWNSGRRAEDVHIYLSAVEPGPTTGKLELYWSGEDRVGRPINTTSQRGHYHAVLLSGNRDGYYFAANTASGVLGELSGRSIAEVTVEAGNSEPVTARAEIDSDREPPVLSVSMVT